MSTSMAVLALAILGLSATASAAPTIKYKITAVPIPGVPGTGNILGAGAALQFHGAISGTEYGGSPPPVTGIKFYAPAGMKLHPSGFATCAPATIEKSTPGACPKKSIAGPKGFVVGVVTFGEARVPETVSVQPLFAPGGNIELAVDGTTPVALELLVSGHVASASPPFGLEVAAEVPLVETVPGALDASVEEGALRFGAAYRQGKKTISYITLPTRCPKGGLPVKAEVSFLGGAIVAGSSKMPCPRK
jgi:hypothetical protein